MKQNISLLILLCVNLSVFAQKTITVKKGDIKVNGEVIATYDGKGGNAFRMGKYTINIPGSDTPYITLKEDVIYFNNPLFDNQHWIYEVQCANGQHFYYRAAPVTKKFFGNTVVLNPRKTGNDIIEEFFNDETPLPITDKALNKENIEKLITKLGYDKDKVMADVKETETAIASIAPQLVARDKAKPVVFTKQTDEDLATWYAIVQDDKIIGRLYKRIGNESIYQVWKKAPAGFTIQGKAAEFVPVAITENLGSGSGSISGKYEGIYVVGKKKFEFGASAPSSAEQGLVNTLVANGIL